MTKISIRVSAEEEHALKKAAARHDCSLSEYIRYKILDQNPDFIDDTNIKYITPPESMHKYLTVQAQVKTMLTLRRLFKHHGIMNEEEFAKFDRANTKVAREILDPHYCKIEPSKSDADKPTHIE